MPALAAEEDFALKDRTAINPFYRELLRLSVDLDLTFLPIKDRAQSLTEIDAAMVSIAGEGSGALTPTMRAQTGTVTAFR